MRAWKLGLMAVAIAVTGTWSWGDDRDEIKSGRMTAQQVSNAFKNTNLALSEGIAAAERQVGGKAIEAQCFGGTDTTTTGAQNQNAVCMITVLTSDNKLVQAKVSHSGQVLDRNNVDTAPGITTTQLANFNKNNISVFDCLKAAERHVNGRAVQVEALNLEGSIAAGENTQSASCKVTLLTNDNKLVQTSVTRTGQVLGQQNVDALVFGSGFAVAPGITTERTTMGTGTTGTQDRDTTGSRVIPASDRPQAGTMGNETASADEFAMPKRLQKASDLIGKNVHNTANENLGEIKDIVLDAGSGRILYGVLSFGGFLGLGDKYFAIPWQSVKLGPDFKNFVLHVDKERLKEAQGFDKNQWPNFADERWATTTYKTFNQTPYWENRGAPTMGSETGTPTNFRDRWYQKVSSWQKASDLIGRDAHNTKNEDIGKLQDLVIDPDAGRIVYGVLSFHGKHYPIPFNAMNMNMTTDNKKVVLNINKDQLKENIAFTDTNWPNMVDPTWSTQVHSAYNVQPYWITTERTRTNNP